MSVVAQVFAAVAALLHGVVFAWETLLIHRPGVHEGIFRIPASDLPAIRLWSFGQGFYNLFLASGTVIGLVLLNNGNLEAGRALVLYTCGFMVLSSFVLFAADRMALSRPKGAGVGGAIAQLVPALVVLLTW